MEEVMEDIQQQVMQATGLGDDSGEGERPPCIVLAFVFWCVVFIIPTVTCR